MAYRGLATILLHVVILSYVVTPGASTPGAQEEDLTDQDPDSPVYTEEWVAHIKGGERHARDVAQEHGFRFVRKVTWVFPKFFVLNWSNWTTMIKI